MGTPVMAGGKWITGLTADLSLADAARHVLTVRLEHVRDTLAPALHQADQDPEHIHQLRVATRRGRAALDIFAVCVPAKVHKHARRALRDLRRAAGEARDWDVFLLTLTERQHRAGTRQRAGFDFLAGYALARRRAAQEHLLAAGEHHPIASDHLLTETVAAIHGPSGVKERRLTDLARSTLTTLLHDLACAAARDLIDYEELHQVRIAGKRLRYAMEVFADCFAGPFREEVYPAVEAMQEILGNANDSHVAVGHLADLRDRLSVSLGKQASQVRPGINAFLRFHRQRLTHEREQFLSWWQHWQAGGAATLQALLG